MTLTIIHRNIDDPSRATNSKNNNYSLNLPIVEIIKQFPLGDWEIKVEAFKKSYPSLHEKYQQVLNKEKIPIILPNGVEIKLSPGKHNQLHALIVHEFCPRFIGMGGKVLYIGDTASSRNEGGKLMFHDSDYLEKLGLPPLSHEKLPDIIVLDEKNHWLFLIEAVTSHGPVSPKRWIELEKSFQNCSLGKVYISAFLDIAEFRKNAASIAWETEVWIAENPDHMIHFNGDRFLGPHKN